MHVAVPAKKVACLTPILLVTKTSQWDGVIKKNRKRAGWSLYLLLVAESMRWAALLRFRPWLETSSSSTRSSRG